MGADVKRKEARKRKFEDNSDSTKFSSLADAAAIESVADTAEQQRPASKKPKMAAETKEQLTQSRRTNNNRKAKASTTTTTSPGFDHEPSDQERPERKSQRFIVFIGNLPFTATDDSIAKHFAKVQPKSIRHRTDREKGSSKGFAFLEFEAYDRMKTCLKLYHHSNFDDGESPARRLNVELTVGGGGGKSKERKAKLKQKNAKLHHERQRRADEEEKQSEKGGKKDYVKLRTHHQEEESAEFVVRSEQDGDIHPSRRSRMAH